jgi:hypothetical protein
MKRFKSQRMSSFTDLITAAKRWYGSQHIMMDKGCKTYVRCLAGSFEDAAIV